MFIGVLGEIEAVFNHPLLCKSMHTSVKRTITDAFKGFWEKSQLSEYKDICLQLKPSVFARLNAFLTVKMMGINDIFKRAQPIYYTFMLFELKWKGNPIKMVLLLGYSSELPIVLLTKSFCIISSEVCEPNCCTRVYVISRMPTEVVEAARRCHRPDISVSACPPPIGWLWLVVGKSP